MIEVVRYTYRLRPGATAERALLGEWHRCRFLWNEAVHQERIGGRPTLCKLSKLLTQARGRNSWLRDGSQVAQQQMLRSYAAALNDSYRVKGRGRPTVKSRKKTLPSLEYTTRGFSIRDRRLRLPGGVTVPVVWSRDLPSEPTSVRVYQDCLGHWYASFVVRREAKPLPSVDGAIGIGRQWARRIVADHQTIAVEDFKPKFLTRSTMARNVADAAIGAAKRELIERGIRAGRKVVLVPPAYTTMTCASCSAIAKQRLTLAERPFRCDQCGCTADRDRNAARVILAAVDPDRAGVDDVRHCWPPSGDAGGAVRVRNPPASAVGKG